jgi:hypothetical protein
MCGDEAEDLAEMVVPADQLGNRRRQVCRWQRRCGLRRGHARNCRLVRAPRQHADLAGKLVAASGDRADQIPLRPEGGAQRRDLGLQIVFLDDPVGPHARHQRVLADDLAARLDQRHQHIEGAPAELDRLAVSDELAAVRHHPETPERDTRRCFGGAFHRSHYNGPHNGPPQEISGFSRRDQPQHSGRPADRFFQVYPDGPQRLFRCCCLDW